MTHVMVDLETLGIKPGCVIASIGACVFGPNGIGETFYVVIDIAKSHGDLDVSTVKWWLNQSDGARQIFSDEMGAAAPEQALCAFRDFWMSVGGKYFWCHGASFDAPILGHAFEEAHRMYSGCLKTPWSHKNIRDTRTLYHLAGTDPNQQLAFGIAHTALDDAKWQAISAVAAMNKIGWPA